MTDLEVMRQRIDQLEQEQVLLRERAEQYRQLYQDMLERCRRLEKGLLAQKSEQLGDEGAQLSLGVLELVLGDRAKQEIEELVSQEQEEQEVKGHTRKKPTGRKPIPENLPRVDIVIVPEEVEREGLDAFEKIGEDVSEVVERRPASLVVARIIKPKFVRKDRDDKKGVIMGETPELPIVGGLAGPGLLADTIVRR